MADYDGVHINEYQIRGVKYVRLWWYVGEGSKRESQGLGRAKSLTKAKINAARLKQEKRLTMQPGRIAAGESPTMAAWFEQWKRHRTDLSTASLSLADRVYELLTSFEHHGVKPFDPGRRIDRITRAEAAAWRSWLSSHDSMCEATVCKYIRTASSVFGTRTGAASVDLIPFNPFARLKKNVKQAVKGFPELSEDDEDRLIDAAGCTGWRAWIALTLLAGTRRAEPTQMLWSRVKWGEGMMMVPNLKTSRDTLTWRPCLMTPRLERVLLSCHEQAEPGQDRIVPMSLDNASRGIEAIVKRSSVDEWAEPFKALRRRRVSLWRSEYPATWVNIWLGHSQSVSDEHYASVPADAYTQRSPTLKRLLSRLESLPEPRLQAIEKLLNKHDQRKQRTQQ